MSTLVVGARIHSVGSQTTAILFDSRGITWLGSSEDAQDLAADERIDARGMFLTPGFVDAHVHATNTGLTIIGLDLGRVTSAPELLDRIRRARAEHPGEPIIGHGWDETRWTDPCVPTRTEFDAAAAGGVVYLSRIDVHSALVSTALLDAVPGIGNRAGFDAMSAQVSRQAHGDVRRVALGGIGPIVRERAQHAFLDRASRNGIVAVHEMAGPTISGEADALALTDLATGPGPRVVLYWGELASAGGIDRARSLGAIGAGGDLFVDGAIGSRTAALHEPYTDSPDTNGALYIEHDEIVDHVVQCTAANVQAGFHVIGDRACDTVSSAFAAAQSVSDADRFRRLRHRIEHAEMVSDTTLARLTRLGITLSMQPLFDGLWAGPGGMYEQRLGPTRAHGMNRWGSATRAGAHVAFSSDCPVTDMSPWLQIHAATHHHDPKERLTVDQAIAAYTRAGWLAAGDDHSGMIRTGMPAHLALWESVPDEAAPAPTCVSTWVGGERTYAHASMQ